VGKFCAGKDRFINLVVIIGDGTWDVFGFRIHWERMQRYRVDYGLEWE